MGQIIRRLCEQKGVEIIEEEACSDHIHMLACEPVSLSVAQFIGISKGEK